MNAITGGGGNGGPLFWLLEPCVCSSHQQPERMEGPGVSLLLLVCVWATFRVGDDDQVPRSGVTLAEVDVSL